MKLDLEANEVQFILNMLGELPTKSGCYPLVVKLQVQVQAQANPEPAEPAQA